MQYEREKVQYGREIPQTTAKSKLAHFIWWSCFGFGIWSYKIACNIAIVNAVSVMHGNLWYVLQLTFMFYCHSCFCIACMLRLRMMQLFCIEYEQRYLGIWSRPGAHEHGCIRCVGAGCFDPGTHIFCMFAWLICNFASFCAGQAVPGEGIAGFTSQWGHDGCTNHSWHCGCSRQPCLSFVQLLRMRMHVCDCVMLVHPCLLGYQVLQLLRWKGMRYYAPEEPTGHHVPGTKKVWNKIMHDIVSSVLFFFLGWLGWS